MFLPDGLVLRPATNADRDAIKSLVFGVLAEYGLSPDVDGTDIDLNDIEANYPDRGGIFEVLQDAGGRVVGSIGLYPLDESVVELRKMYFLPGVRGLGIGRKLLERMVSLAREMGYQRIYLETATRLKEAVHLYESFGFIPVDEKHTPRCDQAYMLELNDEGTRRG